jgi:hypothetical protein
LDQALEKEIWNGRNYTMEFCNGKRIHFIMNPITVYHDQLGTLSLEELDTRLNGLVQAFQGRVKTLEYEEEFQRISKEIQSRL